MIFRNKRGDVNWFIVSLIIIIVSLVVIVLIFLRLNPSGDTDRIACMQSAVIKGTIPDVATAKEIVSLKCKTKRICVTTHAILKGECESELGSDTYTTYRLTGNDESQKNQIKMVIAREMADCWNMLGEGLLQIFKTDISTNSFNGKAVICSRVMFDKTVTTKFTEVDGMNNYLLSHKVPGRDISYWDYLRNAYDGETLQMLNGAIVKGEISSMDIFNDKLDLTKQKAIFYLESSISQIGRVVGAVAGVAGATLLMGSFGGAGSKAVGFLGEVTRMGDTELKLGVLGVAGYYGGNIAQDKYKELIAPGMPEGKDAISGVFLTDYTVEGFRSFQDQKLSFESIS